MELQKTIKFKVGELRKGKQELIDLALNNSVNAIKDFMELSLKNKTTSNKKLHHLGYKEIVKRYNLSACIVHQARNKASEIIRSWKSNKRRLHKNIPKPEPRALRIRFDNVVFDVIKTENKEFQFWASILVAKRKRIYIPLIVNSEWQKAYLNDLLLEKYKKGSADLVKKGEDYFIHIVLKKEATFDKKKDYTPIGIDIGINNLAVININGKPKNEKTLHGIAIVQKTIELIKKMQPKFYVIENPRGMLRKQEVVKELPRDTVTYCQYGAKVQKPTDLFNNLNHKFKPMCKPGSPCHEKASRSTRNGIQGINNSFSNLGSKGKIERAIVPRELCSEIIKHCETKEK